jgi:hypothetical protein
MRYDARCSTTFGYGAPGNGLYANVILALSYVPWVQDDRPAAQPAAPRAPQADTPASAADQQDTTTPGADSAAPTTLSLTVPEGVVAGQQLQIEAPDGRTLLITVPEGVTAGQQLEVSV